MAPRAVAQSAGWQADQPAGGKGRGPHAAPAVDGARAWASRGVGGVGGAGTMKPPPHSAMAGAAPCSDAIPLPRRRRVERLVKLSSSLAQPQQKKMTA